LHRCLSAPAGDHARAGRALRAVLLAVKPPALTPLSTLGTSPIVSVPGVGRRRCCTRGVIRVSSQAIGRRVARGQVRGW
jgi:hypothetical protein